MENAFKISRVTVCFVTVVFALVCFFFNRASWTFVSVETSSIISQYVVQQTSNQSNSFRATTRNTSMFELNCTAYSFDWCYDHSKKWRYLKLGNMRRTTLGIQQCLANKHVLMIGDSRVRYQYLSLAYALVRGDFPHKQECNGSVPHKWIKALYNGDGNWSHFYNLTNHHLSTNVSREVCFCYRQGLFGRGEAVRENRFLRVDTEKGQIHLTYLQSLTDGIHLHPNFPPLSYGPLACSPGECGSSNSNFSSLQEKKVNVSQLLEQFIDRFIPSVTHVFAASGWSQNDIGCDLTNLTKRTGIRTWAINGPAPRALNPFIPAQAPKQSCGVLIFDRTTMSTGVPQCFFQDAVHVRSSLNEEYNHLLLNEVCH